jgi:hypothetical protein
MDRILLQSQQEIKRGGPFLPAVFSNCRLKLLSKQEIDIQVNSKEHDHDGKYKVYRR